MTPGVAFSAILGAVLAVVLMLASLSTATASLRRQAELLERAERAERQLDNCEALGVLQQITEIDNAIRYHTEPRKVLGR